MELITNIKLKSKRTEIIVNECHIFIEFDSIICVLKSHSQTKELGIFLKRLSDSKSTSHSKYSNIPSYMIRFEETYIENSKEPVIVEGFKFSRSKGSIKTTISNGAYYIFLVFKELRFKKIKKEKSTNIKLYLNSLSKTILPSEFNNDLKKAYKKLIISYKENIYTFFYDKTYDTVCLSFNEKNKDDVSNLILLISFYYRIPLQWQIIEEKKRVYTHINFRSRDYPNVESDSLNPVEMINCEELNSIQDFASHADVSRYFNEGDIFQRVVDNYVSCQFYNPVGEFIALCISIICLEPKVVQLSNKDLKNELSKRKIKEEDRIIFMLNKLAANSKTKIDVNKINKSLLNLKEVMTTDFEKGNRIHTFIDLRNELIHGLQSDKISAFLDDNNEIVTKMELANLTIISSMLGIKEIRIKPSYSYFNIYKR